MVGDEIQSLIKEYEQAIVDRRKLPVTTNAQRIIVATQLCVYESFVVKLRKLADNLNNIDHG